MHRPICWLASIAIGVSIFGCAKHDSSQTTGTSGETATASAGSHKLRVALLPKIKGISYFSSCFKGAEEAAKELGIDLIYDGPTDGNPRKQAEMIEQWTIDGVDVICVAPNAPDVVASAMQEARAAGVSVITWDADGTAESRSFFVNQASAQAIGEGLVNAMLEDLGPDTEGDVVIISADATSENQNAWIETMKPALAKSKLKLATIKYPGENASNALADSQDVISKYPNLKGIFGISSVSFPGAAEAVEQSGKVGKILVNGLSTPNDMKKFVQNGTVRSFILWHTVDLGYLTIHVAKALAAGELKPGATSLKAGRLGELSIVGDNVMLGDILVFTKANIDQYDF
ncbi:MAG: substrate-binding domain-containing protein [Planctomycetales bacterium]|nr:substrate-binding domain-containing protein [Planctomycetales bacterium]